MTRHRCKGPGCYKLLPEASPKGGRPRLYCSERCRSRVRRSYERYVHRVETKEARVDATAEERHRLRSAVYAVASEARRLAAALDAEAAKPEYDQPAWWDRIEPERGRPAAPYTRAALELLEAARQAVAAAVVADRTAAWSWAEIGEALGVSADTAARRYRPNPQG
jgi:hypothetical protein